MLVVRDNKIFTHLMIMFRHSRATGVYAQTLLLSSILLFILVSSESTVSLGQSEPSVNKPPIIAVTSPIKGEINTIITINASISDPDGNITSIIWNQEHEFAPVSMNITHDKQSMSFLARENVIYVFSIEGIDNNGSTTLKPVRVNIGDR